MKGDVLNVSHDYRYQKMGYYVSMHAELGGNHVTPGCSDILDTHRNPLLMMRALKAGIPCLPYTLISRYERNVALPALCFAVNPYTCNSVTAVKSESKMVRTMKSLSVNDYRIRAAAVATSEASRSSGRPHARGRDIARKFYDEFHVPIGKLIVQIVDGKARLSHFEPALKKEVDWSLVREKVRAIRAL
jgi:hypothetical protein